VPWVLNQHKGGPRGFSSGWPGPHSFGSVNPLAVPIFSADQSVLIRGARVVQNDTLVLSCVSFERVPLRSPAMGLYAVVWARTAQVSTRVCVEFSPSQG